MSSASSLERDHACPAAIKIREGLDETESVLAALIARPMDYTIAGNEFHERMDAAIREGKRPEELERFLPDKLLYAEHSFVLDLRDMAVYSLGTDVNRNYRAVMASMDIDIPERDCVPGTIDVFGLDADGRAIVIDWKTGLEVETPEHNKQMLFYAFCVSRYLEVDSVTMRIVYRREDQAPYAHEFEIGAMELMAFADAQRALPAKIETAKPGEAVQGGHCRHCEAKPGCVHFKAAVVAAQIAAQHDPEAALMIPEHQRANAVAMLDILAPFVKKLQSALRGDVMQYGDIKLPDGRLYGIRTKKGNEVIDAEKAFPLLEEKYGIVAALAATKKEISKTSLKASLSLAKDEGQTLAAAEREALKLLRDAGAISNRADSETVGFVAAKELKEGAE